MAELVRVVEVLKNLAEGASDISDCLRESKRTNSTLCLELGVPDTFKPPYAIVTLFCQKGGKITHAKISPEPEESDANYESRLGDSYRSLNEFLCGKIDSVVSLAPTIRVKLPRPRRTTIRRGTLYQYRK